MHLLRDAQFGQTSLRKYRFLIEDATVQRRSRIDGPSAIDTTRRAQ
jgi:hypothetical protein